MLDKWIEKIRKCELLPELDLKHLCEYVQEIMLEESTVHPVSSPVTICGDIHGQFHDLLELFRTGGECPETSYIFMVRLSCSPGPPAQQGTQHLWRRVCTGRLCGPRIQQRRDDDAAAAAESALPAQDHAAPGQPREPANHAGLRLLRRVPAQVRQLQPVAVLHRAV